MIGGGGLTVNGLIGGKGWTICEGEEGWSDGDEGLWVFMRG